MNLQEMQREEKNTSVPRIFITKREVRDFFGGIGNTTLHDWIHGSGFPEPIKLSQRFPVWRIKDVVAWVEGFGNGVELGGSKS